jgi:hypothetical protein
MKLGINRRRIGLFVIHVFAQAFFLYMFFSAGRIEKLAEDGGVAVAPGGNEAVVAGGYAAAWRHGMTKGWFLYMPGFFLTAASAWFWSQSITPGRLGKEGALALASCTLLALAASETGGRVAISDFVRDTGARVTSPTAGLSIRTLAQGIYTLIAWTAFSMCGRLCIERRAIKPLLVPAILGVILLAVRPFTLDDAGSIWGRRVLEGDLVAIASALLVPATTWLLVRAELRRLKR